MIRVLLLLVERNQNTINCIKRWELNSDEIFLNKQETHNIEEKVVELASKDAQEEV
jgi:hypothetical protein